MNGVAWFGLGFVSSPALALATVVALDELDNGRSWECQCGYDTGSLWSTRRIVARSRWFWHRRIWPGHAWRQRHVHRWVDVSQLADADRRVRCVSCGLERLVPR